MRWLALLFAIACTTTAPLEHVECAPYMECGPYEECDLCCPGDAATDAECWYECTDCYQATINERTRLENHCSAQWGD